MLEKGIGVGAVRSVPRGTLLLQESPLVIQDASATGETVKAALDLLPREKQREFLALTNQHRGTMNTLLGIFRVRADFNALGTAADDSPPDERIAM